MHCSDHCDMFGKFGMTACEGCCGQRSTSNALTTSNKERSNTMKDPRDLLGMDPVNDPTPKEDDSWRRNFAGGRASHDARLSHIAALDRRKRIEGALAYK